MIVNLEDDAGVNDQYNVKSINQMPCHLGSYILGYSKRLMAIVIHEIDGFYRNSNYYGDADSAYIQKRHWSRLVDNGFVGTFLGFNEHDYGNAGIFYVWILDYLVINDNRLNSAKRSFEGYSNEHRMMKLNNFISLSERKTSL